MNTAYYESPIGLFRMQEENGKVCAIEYVREMPQKLEENVSAVLQETKKQLEEYFEGKRKEFSLPLHLNGTKFQRKVWEALLEIPYGDTCSYKDIAVKIGNPKACRAVGMANNRNKIIIVVPCHRVIGSNGKMVGYACGVSMKEALLQIETGKA